jgi:flagellar protein FlaG
MSGGGFGASGRDPDPKAPDPSRFRLVIEEGPQAGAFVYKTLDRLTGEVIRQFPREEVLKFMADVPASGRVIDTSV